MNSFKSLLMAGAIGLSGFIPLAAGFAQTSAKSYAQYLVETTLGLHPELTGMTFHVQPPDGQDTIVIASNMVPYGKKAEPEDLVVLHEAKILQAPNRAKNGFNVELPLFNRDGAAIGALAFEFAWKPGEDSTRFVDRARQIRNELGHHIANEAQLLQQMDANNAHALLEQNGDRTDAFIDSKEKSRLGVSTLNTPMSDENFSNAFQQATASVTPEDSYKYTNNLSKAGTTGYDLNLRGFTTTASDRGAIITDGEPGATVRFGAPPNVAIDHVEVIKGPAAVLYGAGQPGGFVNVVTRKPIDDVRGEISLTGRLTPEMDQARPGDVTLNRGGALGSFDFNSPLDDGKTLLGRVIVYGAEQNGWRDFSYDHQFFIKPMLSYHPDDRTEIYGSFENREAQSDDFIGLVAPKNDIKLVINRPQTSYQNPGDHITEFGNAEVVGVDHVFDDDVKLDFDARNVHHADYSSGFENNHVMGDFVTLNRILLKKSNDRDYSFGNSNLQIPFDTWSIGNKVVIGVSGGRDFLGTTRFQYLASGSTPLLSTLNISIYDPYGGALNYGTARDPAVYPLCGTGGPGTITTNACNKTMIVQNTNQYTLGLRISDLISLTDQWKIVLAERYDGDWDHFSQVAVQPIAGVNAASTYSQYYIHKFLPMASLIYEPIRNELSFYGTYATGFVPAAGNNNDIHGRPLTDPSTARSEELGVKSLLLRGGLNMTAALFNIQKERTPVGVSCALDTPPGTGCFAPSTTHSKGAEIQGDVRVTPEWHLIAGYSYTEAHIASSPDPASLGARATNTPLHSLHLFSRYDFSSETLKGFGVGIGESVIGTRTGTIPTTPAACSAANGDACYTNVVMKLPGYAVTDLTAYYQISPFDMTLKIGNLFNRGYFQSAGSGTNIKIIEGDPANITLTMRMAF